MPERRQLIDADEEITPPVTVPTHPPALIPRPLPAQIALKKQAK